MSAMAGPVAVTVSTAARMTRTTILRLLVLLLMPLAALADPEATRILQQVSQALDSIDYRGTIVRSFDDRLETLKIAHRNDDGIVREKLVALDGEGREIIRTGDEVLCIFPKSKMVLVESAGSVAGAFSRLPAEMNQIKRHYTLWVAGYERVAGRKSVKVVVRPNDNFRYGHRLWADKQTYLPLRMQMFDAHDRVIEEIRFTDVEIGAVVSDEQLTSGVSTDAFRWVRPDENKSVAERLELLASVRTEGWSADDQAGFSLTDSQMERLGGPDRIAHHLTFSDGLATVSVFIEPQPAAAAAGNEADSRMGAAHSHRRVVGNRQVTVVGEVPAETVHLLAESTERRLESIEAAGEPDR
jgi:sigma-E factor negative regulatory protein RseB